MRSDTTLAMQGLYMGVGLGLGGLVGGFLYDDFGPQATFVLTAAFLAVGWLACGVAQLCLRSLAIKEREESSDSLTALLVPGE